MNPVAEGAAPAKPGAGALARLVPPAERKPSMATRDAYGKALAEIGRENPAVVVLDADLSKSTKSVFFAKEFPDRFFNFGISEADMVGAAAGLASAGKVPFASSFASFLLCKGFDQLRMAVANPGLNAKFVGSHGGISIGEDGASQMSVEDLALACSLPGFTVLCPADEVAARSLTRRAASHVGPVYLRTGRPKAVRLYDAAEDFPFGGSKRLREGRDVTIAACGMLVAEALRAADLLAAKGIETRVLDLYSVKPLDESEVAAAARETRGVVVAEEHLTTGGLGGRVAETLARLRPAPVEFVGLHDTYAESGTVEGLFEKYRLTAPHVAAAAERLLARTRA
jgi:transketolase